MPALSRSTQGSVARDSAYATTKAGVTGLTRALAPPSSAAKASR
jgi:NAD(P)-dependent dehydrogenase (short-subunit alcohol dehydrogenase family)